MSITFYFAPMSTASTVRWSLEELQIPYEGVQVDIKDDADKKTKLGPVNPNMAVPVLVHDGVAIFESAAIQIYLGETFGVDKGLYPKPGPARGEALKWLVWANVTLGGAMSRWLGNTQGPQEQRNAAAGAQARKDLDRLIGMVEENLGDRTYMLGDTVSLVDFHLVSFFQWFGFCGVDFAPFPQLGALIGRCSGRPANQKLMAAET
ncbi:glutathione S-transferase family protein [Enhygromyxa salina]|uniref:Glutathione S-transferase GstB n=1 Tax=Enhygromyxa salina TaxID=215803 RepID=A0A2S9YMB2_9BACT|nr:glutathione S-transferase family protein [Enhygromyxa salina]PRQ06222.1 Glutathione S-transferase GstB [Enhygromyxa salina]